MPPIYFEIDSDTLDRCAEVLQGLGTCEFDLRDYYVELEAPDRRMLVKEILSTALNQEIKEIPS